ncbi:MAG: sporulation protein, partial [Acidimicrobiia bacterium]
MSRVDEILGEARDTLTVRRVFGEPIVQNGVTVVPAAAVRGGGGGGEGEPGEGTPG